MQKLCTRCETTKPLDGFVRRAASSDGYASACKVCLGAGKKIDYWLNREATIARITRNKQERFARDPAYKRAFNLWGTTKKRTTIPACMHITDFVPICRKAIKAGPDYELDHIVPLKHPLVCGLHVPWNLRVIKRLTNIKKRNFFDLS